MLKKSDLKFKNVWQKWNGFLNLVFLSGFVENIKYGNEISFDIRQTGYISHGLKVVLNKGTYLPPDLAENVPVKLYARLQPDIEMEYSSLVLRPIYCARASLHEIPSRTDFLAKGRDSEYKIVDPYLSLIDLAGKPQYQQNSLVKKFQNNVEVAGFVRGKRKISDDCVEFEVWNQENRILPVRLYGKNITFTHSVLTLLRPIKVVGRVEVKEIIHNDKSVKQIYIRAENVVYPIIGKELPREAPNWYTAAVHELKKASTQDFVLKDENGVSKITLEEPLFDENELQAAQVDFNDIFTGDDSVVFDEKIGDIKIIDSSNRL
ncbi:MAG: hypothetical protein K2P99_05440 [Burkholderiales bacterium]|nr:hypothetical protein [Burkholderiales bacterium]